MSEAIVIVLAAFAVYPLAVLGVALTSPHSEHERPGRRL